jgi:hypothetical protein
MIIFGNREGEMKKLGADMWRNRRCVSCGWGIVLIVCTDGLEEIEPYSGWDWWIYCSKPICENHVGEGVDAVAPGWVEFVRS